MAGSLSAGGSCSHLIGGQSDELTFGEMLDFLSPQPARHCVPGAVPGICADDQTHGQAVDLPARGAAVCFSSDDTGTILTELATMCRALGSQCSYAQRQLLKRLQLQLRVQ